MDAGGRIKLILTLEKYDGVVWTGLIWLRIGISGGLCEHSNELSGSMKVGDILQ
jgi:hypothetical protein